MPTLQYLVYPFVPTAPSSPFFLSTPPLLLPPRPFLPTVFPAFHLRHSTYGHKVGASVGFQC